MAAQHGPENIRVNCVCPGMVFTPMVRGRGMTDKMRQDRINQNLLKQEGTGWDVGYGMKLSHQTLHIVLLLTLNKQLSSSFAARKRNGSLA
jgi:NAD(P)-dependent dehydrogenase (short-subunit alcohol dehydrogenase family)